MFNHLARSVAAASLSTILLLAASPLAAAQTRSVAVQSADLNLAKEADRTTLRQRIAHATDRVCGSAHARTTAEVQAYATCSKATLASATAQSDAMVAKAQMNTKVAGDRKNVMSAE